jgi:hypothetical protein
MEEHTSACHLRRPDLLLGIHFSSTLKMEEHSSACPLLLPGTLLRLLFNPQGRSDTSLGNGGSFNSTWACRLEDSTLHSHRGENLKSDISLLCGICYIRKK